MADGVEVKYFCCKNKPLKTVVCIECGEVFHSGCKERSWKEAEIINGALIRCCNPENAELENHYMMKKQDFLYGQLIMAKTQKIQAKDELINTKDQLIKELYAKIESLSNKIKEKPVDITYKSKLLTEQTAQRMVDISSEYKGTTGKDSIQQDDEHKQ